MGMSWACVRSGVSSVSSQLLLPVFKIFGMQRVWLLPAHTQDELHDELVQRMSIVDAWLPDNPSPYSQDELHDELEDAKYLFSDVELTEKEKADLRCWLFFSFLQSALCYVQCS